MNLHPIVIHFPIAFITLYAVLELVRFKRVIDEPYWFYVKAVLICAGSLGAWVAVITGAMTSNFAIGGPRIFAMHQTFGLSSLILSTIIAKAYGWQWYRPNRYSGFIVRPPLIVALAFVLLILITVTGGIGGALAKGTDFDPFMKPIFNLLGIY